MTGKPRDRFFDAPYVDELLRMNTELLAELWIVKDRLMVLEHLVAQKVGLSSDEIDRFVPTGDLAVRLDREREALLKKVMYSPFAEEDRTVEGILATHLGKPAPKG